MEKDTIITLEDNEKFVLLDKVELENTNYFLALKLTEDEQPTKQYEIFEEEIEDGVRSLLHGLSGCHFYIHHSIYSSLCRVGKVRIVVLRKAYSPELRSLCRMNHLRGIICHKGHYTISRQPSSYCGKQRN